MTTYTGHHVATATKADLDDVTKIFRSTISDTVGTYDELNKLETKHGKLARESADNILKAYRKKKAYRGV